MATLKSDIIGRVARLPIRPSERGALLPLMEAVSNSIQSVTDVYGQDTSKKGAISITILRSDNDEDNAIVGFEVEDNGAGFNEDNYKSFLTPDSRLKQKRGGKGVGRLAWLKVFNAISIVSTYREGKKHFRRSFGFQLTEDNQVPGGEAEPVPPTISKNHYNLPWLRGGVRSSLPSQERDHRTAYSLAFCAAIY